MYLAPTYKEKHPLSLRPPAPVFTGGMFQGDIFFCQLTTFLLPFNTAVHKNGLRLLIGWRLKPVE